MADIVKENYFISVVIGTYSKRNDVLNKYAVQSVLNSEYPKDGFEIIIVDNNANKDIHNDLVRMYSNSSQVRIGKEDRPGICFVRNKGVGLSKGDIVCFIDDDCEVDPLWLNRINEFYQDGSVMFGGGSVYDAFSHRRLRESKYDPKWEEERRIPGGNMSFRKQLFKRFRFDENIIYGKDEFELIFRLLKEGYAWYFDEKPIVHHRLPSQYRSGNIKLNKEAKTLEKNSELYFRLKKKMYTRLYPERRQNWYGVEKREKIKIFVKYFFISKKKYRMSLIALEKIIQDINLWNQHQDK